MAAGSELTSLIERSAAGDRAAFDELYARFGDYVYGLCARLLPADQDAEDTAVEVWQTVWLKLGGLREPAAFSGWLRRTVVRACQHRTRRRRWWRWFGELEAEREDGAENGTAVEDQLPADDRDEPAAALEAAVDRAALARGLAALSVDHRTVLVLHHMEGLGLTEISELLAVPAGTLKSRLARARRRLADELAGAEESER